MSRTSSSSPPPPPATPRTARLSSPPPRRPAAARSQLLSGAKEAELSALGVISGFSRPDGLVGDMGGGSLELVDVRDGSVEDGVTLPLGGLALLDLSGASPKKAQKIVREALERTPRQLERLRGRTFYAVGGTWRALARLHQAARDYPLHVMHGYTSPRRTASTSSTSSSASTRRP